MSSILSSTGYAGDPTSSARAQAAPDVWPSAAYRPCSFGGFVQATDPAGLPVHAAPDIAANIVGKLPPVTLSQVLNNGYIVKGEVEILANQGDWFQITEARDNTALTGQAPREVYSGIGWVSGRHLTVKSQAEKGYAAPDRGAPVILTLRDGSPFGFDRMVEAGRLIACRGQWALVEFARQELLSPEIDALIETTPAASPGVPDGYFRVWLDRICGLQETTCDGV